MNYWFLFKCFFIGVSASSAVGPIFILTFNRGALYGFWKGLATACGSALADGVFFALGLLGALELMQNSKQAFLFMDVVGGILLIASGIITIKRHRTNLSEPPPDVHFLLALSKAFILTLVNPFVMLFFMFISLRLLPEGMHLPVTRHIIFYSACVSLGSLTTLSLVAFIASLLGSAINKKKLAAISFFTSCLFIGAGIYFLSDFVYKIISYK